MLRRITKQSSKYSPSLYKRRVSVGGTLCYSATQQPSITPFGGVTEPFPRVKRGNAYDPRNAPRVKQAILNIFDSSRQMG